MTPERAQITGATVILALAVTAGAAVPAAAPPSPESPVPRGGRLVATLRFEPATLNPTTAARIGDMAVIGQLHSSLVTIDRDTLEPVPALAESWEVTGEGRVIDLELRRGVRFSDGEPFDAEDVVLTFEALLDPANASIARAAFVVGGEPVRVTATGSHSVRIELGQPRAAAVRMLDAIAVLPSHRIRPLVESGEWATAWGLATPPGDIVGLGPFRLSRREAGERLVLERNPHYWKPDPQGRPLPYLDEIEFAYVPQDSEVVRFAAGDTDLVDNLSPEDFLALRRGGDDRVMTDAGPGLRYSFLVFNLNDLDGRGSDDLVARQVWFRDRRFRQAVSLAIDREAIARVVYRGLAQPLASFQSPAAAGWSHPGLEPPRRDPEAARALLREAGFTWRGEVLVDAGGREVDLSILVSATSSPRRRIAGIVQQDLESLGLRVSVAPFEFGALVERMLRTHDYDLVVGELGPQDADPMAYVNTLVSGGGMRLWRMGDSPGTDWERELDRLMREQAMAVDPEGRRELYRAAQEIVATELPIVPLVSPNVLVGARVGLGGVRPSVIGSHLLWNADQLYWESGTPR